MAQAAAHPRGASTGPRRRPTDRAVEDPWAGEDDDWTCDLAEDDPPYVIRFFRGAAYGVLAGALLWGLIILGLVLLFG